MLFRRNRFSKQFKSGRMELAALLLFLVALLLLAALLIQSMHRTKTIERQLKSYFFYYPTYNAGD